MFVRISTFLAVFWAALTVAACGPEAVPIVATYEPVDCTCPEAAEPAELPGPSVAGAARDAEGDEAEEGRASEEQPVAKPVAEPVAEPVAKPVAQPKAQKAKAPDRAAPPKEEPEREPPPALDPRVDLNSASAAELRSLPRIGPSKAERILEYRAKRRFRRTKDLMRVKGIGPATYRKLKDQIVVRRGTQKK